MANKYSKKSEKTMDDYKAQRRRMNKTARILALVLAGVMVVFAVVSSLYFLL